MTAEVAVMNKQAIALAADSAVTFPQQMGGKIFTSASKIFTLSKYQPVGVMIYGSASLMEVPWETIIKVYRNELGKETFKTVGDYANNFLFFMAEQNQLFPDDLQDSYVEHSVRERFRSIAVQIIENVEKVIEEKESINDEGIDKITSQIVKEHLDKWTNAEPSSSIPKGFQNFLRKKYSNVIRDTKKEIFENLSLTQQSSRQLTEIAVNSFIRFRPELPDSHISGIVIAGFGTEDVFPVLESFSVESKVANCLKYKKERSANISFENDATIIPFAQSEMVATFMEGVDPNYHNLIETRLEQIYTTYPQVLADNINCRDEKEREELKNRLKEAGQQMFNEYKEELTDYRMENHVIPVMTVVAGLPKDELAAMAETLISLTSFKRRVSTERETVGDPIDVAVISKGDGFIWIKRKHYFQREYNQQFFENYYTEDDTNGRKTTEEAD